jgi:flagellar hook-length control protein FliK
MAEVATITKGSQQQVSNTGKKNVAEGEVQDGGSPDGPGHVAAFNPLLVQLMAAQQLVLTLPQPILAKSPDQSQTSQVAPEPVQGSVPGVALTAELIKIARMTAGGKLVPPGNQVPVDQKPDISETEDVAKSATAESVEEKKVGQLSLDPKNILIGLEPLPNGAANVFGGESNSQTQVQSELKSSNNETTVTGLALKSVGTAVKTLNFSSQSQKESPEIGTLRTIPVKQSVELVSEMSTVVGEKEASTSIGILQKLKTVGPADSASIITATAAKTETPEGANQTKIAAGVVENVLGQTEKSQVQVKPALADVKTAAKAVELANDSESGGTGQKNSAKENSDSKSLNASTSTAAKQHVDPPKQFANVLAVKTELKTDPVAVSHGHAVPLSPDIAASIQQQIAKEVSLKIQSNVSEMRVVLKPESLGEVTVNVRMENGTMVARIDVSQPNVRTALESNLPQLRDTLLHKGIQVDRIDILTASNSSSRESSNQPREKGKSSSKRRLEVEQVEANEPGRYLGYNTMDYLI